MHMPGNMLLTATLQHRSAPVDCIDSWRAIKAQCCGSATRAFPLNPPLRVPRLKQRAVMVAQLMKQAQEKGVVVVDPLASLENVLDRRTLRSKLPDLLKRTEGRVAWSESLEVQDEAAAASLLPAMQSMLHRSDGVLFKPCVACGVPESHEMCLVRSAEALPPHVSLPRYLSNYPETTILPEDILACKTAACMFRGLCLLW